MGRFASAREAKEFLVEKIADEARAGVSLSDVERKMLYFSETGWAPAETVEACHRFDSECNRREYETKIAQLIRNTRKRARSEGKHALAAWSNAIGTLSGEDHYLLVMSQEAGLIERPPGDRLRLWTTAFAIVLAGLGLAYVAERLGISLVVFFWGIALCASGAYLLFRVIAGRERADRFLNWLLGFFDQRS
jgi:hypothetical protein